MQTVIGVTRKYMKVVVPDILVAGRPVVLASRYPFATEDLLHGVRQAARGTKEVAAKVVGDVQHVLIVMPGYHQAVAFYPGVVVSRNQGEHVRVRQDNCRFRSRRWKCLGNTAERTFVS